jgi:hypothetical protein
VGATGIEEEEEEEEENSTPADLCVPIVWK